MGPVVIPAHPCFRMSTEMMLRSSPLGVSLVWHYSLPSDADGGEILLGECPTGILCWSLLLNWSVLKKGNLPPQQERVR